MLTDPNVMCLDMSFRRRRQGLEIPAIWLALSSDSSINVKPSRQAIPAPSQRAQLPADKPLLTLQVSILWGPDR